MSRTRVLVLGASGMLGSAVVKRLLALESEFEVRASVRGRLPNFLPVELAFRVDAFSDDAPVLPTADWAFNCIGLIKQRTEASPPAAKGASVSCTSRRIASSPADKEDMSRQIPTTRTTTMGEPSRWENRRTPCA